MCILNICCRIAQVSDKLCFVNTWEVEQARRIGAEVQRLRRAAGQSAQGLSDRTERLGLKITRQAIADLENGRRRFVTTAELTIIAAALDTSPVMLIYPGPYDGEVIEALPDVEASKLVAAEWFSANAWFGVAQEPGDDPVTRWREATLELTLNRQLADLQHQRSQAQFEGMATDLTPENLAWHNGRIKLLDDSIADIRLRLGMKGSGA